MIPAKNAGQEQHQELSLNSVHHKITQFIHCSQGLTIPNICFSWGVGVHFISTQILKQWHKSELNCVINRSLKWTLLASTVEANLIGCPPLPSPDRWGWPPVTDWSATGPQSWTTMALSLIVHFTDQWQCSNWIRLGQHHTAKLMDLTHWPNGLTVYRNLGGGSYHLKVWTTVQCNQIIFQLFDCVHLWEYNNMAQTQLTNNNASHTFIRIYIFFFGKTTFLLKAFHVKLELFTIMFSQ